MSDREQEVGGPTAFLFDLGEVTSLLHVSVLTEKLVFLTACFTFRSFFLFCLFYSNDKHVCTVTIIKDHNKYRLSFLFQIYNIPMR